MAIFFTPIDRNGAQGERQLLKKWIKAAVETEGYTLSEIVIAFCSDYYIKAENNRFLSHDYATDIITFDRTEGKKVAGDLLISIDRIRDNAKEYKTSFDDEFHRVIIHGVLHMIGYDDHSEKDRAEMRRREDFYLQQFQKSGTQIVEK